MLIKLSWRNAKRQSKDYLLYLITLICSASFLYAFNSLVFSDSVKDISELEILPYLIIATSLLIIFHFRVDRQLYDELYAQKAQQRVKYLYGIGPSK